MSVELNKINESGKGRVFLLIYDDESYQDLVTAVFTSLSLKTRCLLLKSSTVSDDNWEVLSKRLVSLVDESNIRQLSIVSFSDASSIALNLALKDLKIIRTLVLVDASTRPHPSFYNRFIDKLERFFPLGLPLKSHSKAFQAKPYLQRVRCPLLAIVTDRATLHVKNAAREFAELAPTAWTLILNREKEVESLVLAVLEFEKVPAKCPQKNQLS